MKLFLLPKLPSKSILRTQVEEAATLDKLFCITVAHLCSWFNNRHLECFIEHLGDDYEKSLWKEYQETCLKPYLKKSIFEIPSKSFAPEQRMPQDTLILPVLTLIDDIDLEGSEIDIITQKLSEFLDLPSLMLVKYDDGCVCLIFAIPKDIFDDYSEESALHQHITFDEDTGSYHITADITNIL